MNRKLHNSLTAALTSCALLVVALLFSAPVESTADMLPGIASGDTAAITAPPLPARSHHRLARRSYQSVRMPFFSFVYPQG